MVPSNLLLRASRKPVHARPGRTRVLTDHRACARIQQRRLAGPVRSDSRNEELWGMGRGQGCADRFLAPPKGLEADAILTAMTPPVRYDTRERGYGYVARSRERYLFTLIDVVDASVVSMNEISGGIRT